MRRSRSIEKIAYSRAFSTTRRSRSSDSRSACSVRRALADVEDDRRPPRSAAVGVEHRRHRGAHPDDAAVAAHDSASPSRTARRRRPGGWNASMLRSRSSGWTSANTDVPTSARSLRPSDRAKRALASVMRPSRSSVDDAGRRLVDDGAKQRLRLAQRLADAAPLGDVDEGEHDAADAVVGGAVRAAAARAASARRRATSRSIGTSRSSTRARVVVELAGSRAGCARSRERPADVGRDQVEQLDRRRREAR